MTTNHMRCDLCGGPLIPRREGSSEGMYCPNCDRWVVVTTYMPPIQLDRTNYRVLVATSDYRNKAHIQAVGEVAVVNFLQAREILRRERPQVFAGRAEEVAQARDTLTKAGISVEIDPPFPW